MVSFWVYDVIFMVLFSAFIIQFLYRRKKDLSREGLMFMWRTKFGMKAINYIGDKHKKLLGFLSPIIITVGFILMALMLMMLGQTVSLYIFNPEITSLIKAPPIAPLIPYFPKIFGMESMFPPFYFTYFILALAIVAIVHEFSHGIFMRRFKIKIKSTGMVFFGPIIGAFVEQDDKSMNSKKNFEQMSVLAAGVFANLIFALIFYGLYVLFFLSAFTPSGYTFNSYGISAVPVENVTGFANSSINYMNMTTDLGNFYLDESMISQLQQNSGYIYAYEESPAFLAQMKGAIIQADDVKIIGQDSLREFLQNKNPGDLVVIKTENKTSGKMTAYSIRLSKNPTDSSRAYLGVGNFQSSQGGIVQKILAKFMDFKDSTIYYKTKYDGNFVEFTLNFFWWVMIINLLVALFNMLPLGILDGGRFFFLGVESLTKSEKAAKAASRIMKYIILFGVIVMMVFWLINVI